MGQSYSVYYAKTEHPERLTKLCGAVQRIADSAWIAAGFRRDASPPDDDLLWGERSLAGPRSQEIGELIFLYADSSGEGSFVYEHAAGGRLLRKLVWFPMLDDDWTPGWLCAVGEPQEWEAKLFNPARLDAILQHEKEILADAGRLAEFAARESEIRAYWSGGIITAPNTLPPGDASLAALVERHFGIIRPAA